MLTVISSTPSPDAQQVPLFPAAITLTFDRKVERGSIERALTITPSAAIHVRWTEVPHRRLGAPPSDPRRPIANLVMVDQLHVLVPGTFDDWKAYLVRLDPAVARGADGSALAAPYELRFHTRAQSVDLPPPGLHRGPSRADIPRGGYKRALVLSGGGSRGSFQIGALRQLYEAEQFYPDLIVGTSVGAINAVKLAEADGTPADHLRALTELIAFWHELRHDDDIVEDTPAYRAIHAVLDAPDPVEHLRTMSADEWLGVALPLPFLGAGIAQDVAEDAVERAFTLIDALRASESLTTFGPLARRMGPGRLDQDRVRRSPIELQLAAVDLITGRTTWFGKAGDQVFAALASAAIPLFYQAQRTADAVYVDGGVREVAGLDQALRLGATDIVVIPTYAQHGYHHAPRRRERYRDLLGLASRAILDVTFDEILRTDLGAAIARQTVLNRYGDDVRIRVIAPEVDIYPSASFHPEGIRRAMTYGYQRAAHVVAGAPRTPPPQPIAPSRSAGLLIVKPVSPSGEPVPDPVVWYEHAGGLGQDTDRAAQPDLRIIVRHQGQVVYTYPSDHLWSYGDVVVPGSDDDLASPLQPYSSLHRYRELRAAAGPTAARLTRAEFIRTLPPTERRRLWRRRGQVYALPVHHPDAPLPPGPRSQPLPLEVEVIQTFRKDGLREVRTTQEVRYVPDAEGVMEVEVRMPAELPTGAGPGRLVRFTHDRRDTPPALTLFGPGFGDLTKLRGHDGVWSGDGAFQCSRDAALLPAMRGVEIFRGGVTVEVFAGPTADPGPGAQRFTSPGFHRARFPIQFFQIGLRL